MVNEAEVVEKKLGMSLDELIAEQKKKQGSRPAGGAKKKTVSLRDHGGSSISGGSGGVRAPPPTPLPAHSASPLLLPRSPARSKPRATAGC